MLARAREFLTRKGIEEARLDAELLVSHALGLDRLGLFMALERPLTPEEITLGRQLLVRRAAGEPTAYVLGYREFYGRRFEVGAGVLIPRPDTELLVDLARERAGDRPALRVADFGTGSGCVATTLALELTEPDVHAFDVSTDALAFAERSAIALDASVQFHAEDGLEAVESCGPFDLVVSNPPYIAREITESLTVEVRDHEPAVALFAPEGDTDFWARALIDAAPRLLKPGGTLLIELGFDQAERLSSLPGVQMHKDYGGIERVLELALQLPD